MDNYVRIWVATALSAVAVTVVGFFSEYFFGSPVIELPFGLFIGYVGVLCVCLVAGLFTCGCVALWRLPRVRSVVDKRGVKLTACKPFLFGYYVKAGKKFGYVEDTRRGKLSKYKFTVVSFVLVSVLTFFNHAGFVFYFVVGMVFFFEQGRRRF